MKAVVWHGIGDIRLDDVPMPQIQELFDAIIRLTASAICGTDLSQALQWEVEAVAKAGMVSIIGV